MSDQAHAPAPPALPDGCELLETLAEAHIHDLLQLFRGESWTSQRSLEDTREVVENSQVNLALVDTTTNRLVAYTRVLTDYRFFAVVHDVIVAPDQRGRGLGRALIDAALAHPRLQRLAGIGLQCAPDLVPFYAAWGFEPMSSDRVQLVRRFPDRVAGASA